jgi:HSP20 family protein
MNTLALRWRPDLGLNSMFRDLDRWMRHQDDGFARLSAPPAPQFASEQDDDAYYINAEVPGFSDKDLRVELQRGVLTVSGEQAVAAPEGYRAAHRERGVVKFSRTVQLPDEVDEEQAKASVKDGVLTITLPKRPEVKPRQIAVTAQ